MMKIVLLFATLAVASALSPKFNDLSSNVLAATSVKAGCNAVFFEIEGQSFSQLQSTNGKVKCGEEPDILPEPLPPCVCSAKGDPHTRMFRTEYKYDFQNIGEFTFSRSNDEFHPYEVQVRQQKCGKPHRTVSCVKRVAIKLEGEVFELPSRGDSFLYNGQSVTLGAGQSFESENSDVFVIKSKKEFQVTSGAAAVTVSYGGTWIKVTAPQEVANKGAIDGLCGTCLEQNFVARDGTAIANKFPKNPEITAFFGCSWAISADTSLFTYTGDDSFASLNPPYECGNGTPVEDETEQDDLEDVCGDVYGKAFEACTVAVGEQENDDLLTEDFTDCMFDYCDMEDPEGMLQDAKDAADDDRNPQCLKCKPNKKLKCKKSCKNACEIITNSCERCGTATCLPKGMKPRKKDPKTSTKPRKNVDKAAKKRANALKRARNLVKKAKNQLKKAKKQNANAKKAVAEWDKHEDKAGVQVDKLQKNLKEAQKKLKAAQDQNDAAQTLDLSELRQAVKDAEVKAKKAKAEAKAADAKFKKDTAAVKGLKRKIGHLSREIKKAKKDKDKQNALKAEQDVLKAKLDASKPDQTAAGKAKQNENVAEKSLRQAKAKLSAAEKKNKKIMAQSGNAQKKLEKTIKDLQKMIAKAQVNADKGPSDAQLDAKVEETAEAIKKAQEKLDKAQADLAALEGQGK